MSQVSRLLLAAAILLLWTDAILPDLPEWAPILQFVALVVVLYLFVVVDMPDAKDDN